MVHLLFNHESENYLKTWITKNKNKPNCTTFAGSKDQQYGKWQVYHLLIQYLHIG